MRQQLPEVGVGDSSLLYWETVVLGAGVEWGQQGSDSGSVCDHIWAHGMGGSPRRPARVTLFEG